MNLDTYICVSPCKVGKSKDTSQYVFNYNKQELFLKKHLKQVFANFNSTCILQSLLTEESFCYSSTEDLTVKSLQFPQELKVSMFTWSGFSLLIV